jgi:hypothetical protein
VITNNASRHCPVSLSTGGGGKTAHSWEPWPLFTLCLCLWDLPFLVQVQASSMQLDVEASHSTSTGFCPVGILPSFHSTVWDHLDCFLALLLTKQNRLTRNTGATVSGDMSVHLPDPFPKTPLSFLSAICACTHSILKMATVILLSQVEPLKEGGQGSQVSVLTCG